MVLSIQFFLWNPVTIQFLLTQNSHLDCGKRKLQLRKPKFALPQGPPWCLVHLPTYSIEKSKFRFAELPKPKFWLLKIESKIWIAKTVIFCFWIAKTVICYQELTHVSQQITVLQFNFFSELWFWQFKFNSFKKSLKNNNFLSELFQKNSVEWGLCWQNNDLYQTWTVCVLRSLMIKTDEILIKILVLAIQVRIGFCLIVFRNPGENFWSACFYPAKERTNFFSLKARSCTKMRNPKASSPTWVCLESRQKLVSGLTA